MPQLGHFRKVFLLLLGLLSACSIFSPQVSQTPSSPEVTDTPSIPTPTEPPLAIRVNGEGVWLAEYQTSLHQFQQAQISLGTQYTDEEAKQLVLNDLENQVLLGQGAKAAGYHPDPYEVQNRMDSLATQMGGQSAFLTWLQDNYFTEDIFRQSLTRSIAADWQKQQLMSHVPTVADQVHARQILVYSSDKANQIYANLQAGSNFQTLAFQYDPLTGGDLGWFPRGYLTQKVVEDAAFTLQSGEHSGIIQTEFGYHIVEVIERDPAHPISADAIYVLQKASVAEWIAQQKAQSTIEILVP